MMMDQRAKFTALGLKAEYVGTAQETQTFWLEMSNYYLLVLKAF